MLSFLSSSWTPSILFAQLICPYLPEFQEYETYIK